MSMKNHFKRDGSLDTLLDLDGEIFPMDNGYWSKFEAKKVEPTNQIPHGIRYSLTLHDRNNTRILGFDNAHVHKTQQMKYGARKVTRDHKHKTEKVYNYEFKSASRLLEDFWDAVDQILK